MTATVQGDTTWATSKVVKVVVGSGTATEGTDFKTVDDFDITIPAGAKSATGSFTLDPEDDDIDEGTGETVEITGSTSASDTVDGTEVTIEDDDKAPTGIALSATVPDNGGTTDTLSEDDAAQTVTVTATVQGDTTWATSKVVKVVVGSGTATEGTDFKTVDDFDITIPAGSSSATGTFTLDPEDDDIDEGTGETVEITGSTSASDTVDGTEVTIEDDDKAPTGIALSATVPDNGGTTDTLSEDDAAQTVTVTATVQGDTTWATSKVVKVVVGSGTATEGTDFKTVDDFDITIPAGSSSATGTFTLDPEDDDIDEGTGETVEITGSTSASDTVDGTEVTIEDDDKAPTGIALSATVPDNGGTTDTLSEDDAAQTVTVTATVQGDTTWATSKVVKVVVGSGTATEGTDFKTVDDFDITIPAGSSSATGSFTLDPEDDDIDEGTGETVEITGSTSASDTVDGTEVTIEDDDKAPTGIALSATVPDNGGTTDTLSEDDAAQTVTVTATVQGDTTWATSKVVKVVVGSGTATEGTDFKTVDDFDITIPAGSSSATGTFTLDPEDDDIDEGTGETVEITGSTSASDTVDGTEVTIEDDDKAPTGIALSATVPDNGGTTDTLSEDDDAQTVTVTATVQGDTTWATSKVVKVVVGSGTATEGTDFKTVDDFDITIPAGSSSATGTFTLDPEDDDIDEGTGETVEITGSTSASDTVDGTEVTIEDDDTSEVSIEDASVKEGGVVTFVVRLSKASSSNVLLKWVTADGTAGEADYTPESDGDLTINAGKTSETFTVQTIEDEIAEGDENFTVSLSARGTLPAGVSIATAQATGTITDDDEAYLSGTDTVTVEENEIEVDVYVVTGAPPSATVVWSVVDGDDGGFEIDVDGALTFRTAPDFETPTDADKDNVYDVTVKAATGGGRALASRSVAVTVADVAEPPPAPEAPTVTGASNVSLDVSWTAPTLPVGIPPVTGYKLRHREEGTSGSWSSHVHADDSTATTIADLDPATSYEVQVMASNHEGDSPWSESGTSATGQTVLVSIADASAMEGEEVTFTVQLSSDAGTEVILNWTTADGTAEASCGPPLEKDPCDYIAASGSVTIPDDATDGTIAIETVGDVMVEGDETFTIMLSAPGGGLPAGVALTDPEATGTIKDNDVPTKIVLIATVPDETGGETTEIAEGDGEKTVTVKAKVEGGLRFPMKRFVRAQVDGSGSDGVVGFAASPDAFDIEIPAGHVSASRTFLLTPEDNDEDEDEETIEISGEMLPEAGRRARQAVAPSEIPVQSAKLTLIDDDEIVVHGPTDVEVDEGEVEVGTYDIKGAAEGARRSWSLAGEDVGLFRIDVGGALAFRTAPDFAAPADRDGDNVHQVTVSAEVGGKSASLPVTVTVLAVTVLALNAAPQAEEESYTFSLKENQDGREEPVELGTVTASDPDADDLTYEIAAGDESLFSIDPASGDLTYIGPGEDYENEPNSYDLTVIATDGDGLYVTFAVTVEVIDVNEQPVFDRKSYEFKLAENRIGPVGLGTVTASDPDVNDTPTYEIAAGDTNLFALDGTSGILTYIGPGEDYENEPNSYELTVNATNGDGLIAEALVKVTVTKEEDAITWVRLMRVNEAILPELSRTMLSGVVEVVARRIKEASPYAPVTREGYTFAGYPNISEALFANEQALNEGTMDWKRAFAGSSFALALGGVDSPPGKVTLWGEGNWRALSAGGQTDPVELEGDVTAARFGLDAHLGENLLAGLALSWSQSALDYTDRGEAGYLPVGGTHETRMTSVHPYVGWWSGEHLGLWGTVGYGAGEVEIDDEEAGTQSSEGVLKAAALGGRLRLFSEDGLIPGGTTALTLKGEVWAARFDLEDNGGLMQGLGVNVNRLRLGLEGEHVHVLSLGATLTPSLELGLRHDGGDGEIGAGVELGGGLSWTDPAQGLSANIHGRALLAHRGDVKEWGVGGLVTFGPGAGVPGLSLSLRPSWGEAEGGLARLWENELAAANDAETAARLEAEIGYGLRAAGGHGVLTPYAGLSLSGGEGRTWRLGGRLEIGPAFHLSLEGERRETDAGPADHGIMLKFRLGLGQPDDRTFRGGIDDWESRYRTDRS